MPRAEERPAPCSSALPPRAMELAGLLLLLGPCALWTGLLAAPARQAVPGASPPSGGSPARARECGGVVPTDATVSTHERLCAVAAPAMAAAWDSSLTGRLESQGGRRGCERLAFPREMAIPTEAGAAPSPPGKRPCGKPPQAGAGTASSSAGKPMGGSEQDALLDERPQPGRGHFSGGTPAPGKRPVSVGSPGGGPTPAPPSRGVTAAQNATSGKEPVAAGEPASGIQHGKPASAPAGKPCPRPGHTAHGKPVPGGKPASPTGHLAHTRPPPGEKPAPSTEHARPGKPSSVGKPASAPGQASHAAPAAPHGKPDAGAKPAAEEEHKPETGAASEEKGDDEDAFDAEEDGGGDGDGEGEGSEGGGNSAAGDGDRGEADDAFDKELDYGLSRPPFNAYAYHDAWSDDDSEDDPPAAEEGPQEWPPASSTVPGGGVGVFDAWGDTARGPRV